MNDTHLFNEIADIEADILQLEKAISDLKEKNKLVFKVVEEFALRGSIVSSIVSVLGIASMFLVWQIEFHDKKDLLISLFSLFFIASFCGFVITYISWIIIKPILERVFSYLFSFSYREYINIKKLRKSQVYHMYLLNSRLRYKKSLLNDLG